MHKNTATSLLLFAVVNLNGCGGSDSSSEGGLSLEGSPGGSANAKTDAEPSSSDREKAKANFAQMKEAKIDADTQKSLEMLKTSRAYVEQVTQILSTVTNDATAQAAIVEIDKLGDERETFNALQFHLGSTGIVASHYSEYVKLKKGLEAVMPGLEEQLNRIIFSGPSGAAIPKSGPMREVTRAVKVAKPERRG